MTNSIYAPDEGILGGGRSGSHNNPPDSQMWFEIYGRRRTFQERMQFGSGCRIWVDVLGFTKDNRTSNDVPFPCRNIVLQQATAPHTKWSVV